MMIYRPDHLKMIEYAIRGIEGPRSQTKAKTAMYRR